MMKKIKLIFLATVCVISIGSAPAYAINKICVIIHNNLSHEVYIYGYDIDDAVMWVPLDPGVETVPNISTRKIRVCYLSEGESVKIWYKSEQSKGLLGLFKHGDRIGLADL